MNENIINKDGGSINEITLGENLIAEQVSRLIILANAAKSEEEAMKAISDRFQTLNITTYSQITCALKQLSSEAAHDLIYMDGFKRDYIINLCSHFLIVNTGRLASIYANILYKDWEGMLEAMKSMSDLSSPGSIKERIEFGLYSDILEAYLDRLTAKK
jgi:hypothetical protein